MLSFPFFEAFVVFTLDSENQTPRKGKESVGQNGRQSERIAEGVTTGTVGATFASEALRSDSVPMRAGAAMNIRRRTDGLSHVDQRPYEFQ
jgi:hypothetical protein